MNGKRAARAAPGTCPHCGSRLCAQCGKPMDGPSHNPDVHDECAEICMGCYERVMPGTLDAGQGYCADCVADRELKRENVRRLEAWAVAEGSRRGLAEGFAREASTTWHAATRRAFVQAVFVWETSGERRALRKIVELLMHDREARGSRFVVNEPPVVVPQEESAR